MKKLEILPTHLYEFELPDSLYKKLLKKVDSLDFNSCKTRENKQYFGRCYMENKGLNKEKDWQFLNTYVNQKLDEVSKDVRYDLYTETLKTTLMWVNKSDYMQWHHPHVHPWSILSGIIYLRGNAGQTWFSRSNEYELDRRFLSTCNDNTKPDGLFEIIYKHKPKNKTMIIFPSMLKHSVDENTSEEPRITISFNSFFSGESGNLGCLTYIDFKF